MTEGKVIVIGLDGATFSLLKPWMEAGHLSYLKSLMERGVHGALKSSIPPVTSPAWQCFMTGKNPGKHGVVWFLEERPGNGQQMLASATSCEGKTLWDLLSEAGKHSLVLNVPFTFPSEDFHGIMIGGFDIPPSRKAEFVHPPGLLREIEDSFGEYQVHLKLKSSPIFMILSLMATGNGFATELLLKNCEELTRYQFQVAEHLLEHHQFDFIMFYQLTPDRIQHALWHLLDEMHPRYNAQIAEKFRDRILDYYSKLDRQIAQLVQKAGPETHVIVMSDHGSGPLTKAFDLSSWLLKEGYIQIRKHPFSQLKYFLWKMGWGPTIFPRILLRILVSAAQIKGVQRRILAAASQQSESAGRAPTRLADLWRRIHINRLFLSAEDIDWSKTKALWQTGPGLIRLNIAGREPFGGVPRQEYAALRDEIVAKLRQLMDPTTGRPVMGDVFVKEEIYQGKYADRMPDIVFVSLSDCLVTSHLTFATSRLVIDIPAVSGFPLISGHHRPDGVLLAKGPAFRRGGSVEGATIVDLAPTILYLMGGKIPNDMDGRVLTALFEEQFLGSRPIVFTEASPVGERSAVELTQADREAVLDRLKGLGYID